MIPLISHLLYRDFSRFAPVPSWFLSFCSCSVVIILVFHLDLYLKCSVFLADSKVGMCCHIYLKVPNTIQFYENASGGCRSCYMMTSRWPDSVETKEVFLQLFMQRSQKHSFGQPPAGWRISATRNLLALPLSVSTPDWDVDVTEIANSLFRCLAS